MGWCFYNTARDRKDECDHLWAEGIQVVKSVMVGSVYYAALKDTENGDVFGMVVLTRSYLMDGYNFGYKAMSESCGPYNYDCPIGILNLLTETDNKYAMEWRNKCRENANVKRSKQALNKLPYGTVIEITYRDKPLRIVKCAPNRQFKNSWWKYLENNYYLPKKYITGEYKIVA